MTTPCCSWEFGGVLDDRAEVGGDWSGAVSDVRPHQARPIRGCAAFGPMPQRRSGDGDVTASANDRSATNRERPKISWMTTTAVALFYSGRRRRMHDTVVMFTSTNSRARNYPNAPLPVWESGEGSQQSQREHSSEGESFMPTMRDRRKSYGRKKKRRKKTNASRNRLTRGADPTGIKPKESEFEQITK